MREIKYRAWDKKLKLMAKVISLSFYEDDSPYKGNETESFLYFEKLDTTGLRPFNEIELMQYTGLKDKNGIFIYEGDILKTRSGNIQVVRFEKISMEDDTSFTTSFFCFSNTRNWLFSDDDEVIGSIYENSELLAGD